MRRQLRRPGVVSFIILAVAAASAACSTDSPPASGMIIDTTSTSGVATLSGAASSPAPGLQEAIQAVASRHVYFAHQSVGGNIIAGIEAIRAGQPAAGLQIVETREPGTVRGPAFVHFLAGRNTDPGSKNADFLAVLDARPARDGGIALLKYCYLDMRPDSDPAAIFAAYRATVSAVRTRHPDLTIVHVTMPLTTVEGAGKALVKRLLGRPTMREIARKRQQYNSLLVREYGTHEPVFDIAALEATRPDGARAAFRMDRDTVPVLAPDYTDDGGHLNARGQRLVAERLLAFLATVPVQPR